MVIAMAGNVFKPDAGDTFTVSGNWCNYDGENALAAGNAAHQFVDLVGGLALHLGHRMGLDVRCDSYAAVTRRRDHS